MPNPVDFRSQLTRQLGFLHRSCHSFDEGFADEAIRVATIIRILMHETKNQRPLLRHLKAMDIRLNSTCGSPTERAVMFTGMGRVRFTGGKGVKWSANTDLNAIDRAIVLADWWNQTVYIHGSIRLTRKDIVLAAADKDGGAHVDSKLTTEYESLMNVGGNGFWRIADMNHPGVFHPIIDAHLVYLRQMGFELLNSPELLDLCKV